MAGVRDPGQSGAEAHGMRMDPTLVTETKYLDLFNAAFFRGHTRTEIQTVQYG